MKGTQVVKNRKVAEEAKQGNILAEVCVPFFSPNLVTDEGQSLRMVVTEFPELI